MEDVAPVLLMAVVAVILCAFFVGAALSWSFALALPAALLLGSIVATTDPIAVVGIFRDLGAPSGCCCWSRVRACSTTPPPSPSMAC